MHTRSRLPSFVRREDKSEKNWSGSRSRCLSVAVAVTSLQRGDEANVEVGTTTVRKGRWLAQRRRWQDEGRGDDGGAATEEKSEARRLEPGNVGRCHEVGQVSRQNLVPVGRRHVCRVLPNGPDRWSVENSCVKNHRGEKPRFSAGSPAAKGGLRGKKF